MTSFHISPRTRFYNVECSETEKQILAGLNISTRFEALSIGQTPNGATVCLVPLDESNRETAELLAASPSLRDALIDMLENGDARSRQGARAALRKAGVKI